MALVDTNGGPKLSPARGNGGAAGWENRRPTGLAINAAAANPAAPPNASSADLPPPIVSPRAQAWGKASKRVGPADAPQRMNSSHAIVPGESSLPPPPAAAPAPLSNGTSQYSLVDSNRRTPAMASSNPDGYSLSKNSSEISVLSASSTVSVVSGTSRKDVAAASAPDAPSNAPASAPVNTVKDPARDFLVKQHQVRLWIEDVLNEKILENIGSSTADGKRYSKSDLFPPLRDGILLCRLMNALEKGSVPKINKSGEVDRSAYMAMENVQFFLAAASNFGVGADKLFAPLDLYSRANMVRVISCLWELAEISFSRGFTKSNIRDKSLDASAKKWSDDETQLATLDVEAAEKAAKGKRRTVKEARSQSEMWRIANELEEEVKKKEDELAKLRWELKEAKHEDGTGEHAGATSGCCVVQ